ncbi:MAG: NADP-dependent oxidoreductase [Mycobacteriaceae bacterium]|uniref:NADP-dependent oxidoreductase n=1 Tax=Corynebacterium sp. TaxID=1720 RepID=UPI003F9BC46B
MRIFGFESYGGPGTTRLLDVPAPGLPESPAVLVGMLATTVNPADIKVRSGERQGKVPVTFPMAMGREAAGRVLAASPGSGVSVGDLVVGGTLAGHGSYAERVLLDPAQTTRVPEDVSPEQAACVPVAVGTAWDALHELAHDGLPDGGTVAVLGSGGGVGHVAVQLARHLGFAVVGVASESKRELVTGLGATFVASGTEWDGSADALVDTVGGDALERIMPHITGPVRSTAGGPPVTRRRTGGVFSELLDLMAAGTVEPLISASYPLADAADAVATVEDGHATGKTVIVT